MNVLAQTTTTQSPVDTNAVAAGLAAMSGVIAIAALVFVLFTILIWFMIFRRTGMNPWLSLLMLVPLANFVMLLILAFTEWPVQRANAAMRAQLGGGYAGGAPGPATGYASPYGSTLPPPGTPPATT